MDRTLLWGTIVFRAHPMRSDHVSDATVGAIAFRSAERLQGAAILIRIPHSEIVLPYRSLPANYILRLRADWESSALRSGCGFLFCSDVGFTSGRDSDDGAINEAGVHDTHSPQSPPRIPKSTTRGGACLMHTHPPAGVEPSAISSSLSIPIKVPRQIRVVRAHVKMAVPAEVEQNDLLCPFFLCLKRLDDRRFDGVR